MAIGKCELSEPNVVQNEECDKTKSFWSTLLYEVANKASMKLPSTRVLLVFGDNNSGKTTLLAHLQGDEDLKKGYGLQYTMIDIKDDERDEQTKLNVWVMDGDVAHSHLLKFPLNATTFGECAVLITVSMAEPWNIIVSLEKWVAVLKDHIQRLPIEAETLRQYKEGLLLQFHEYSEPSGLKISEAHEESDETICEQNDKPKLLEFRRPTLISAKYAVPLLSLKQMLARPSIGSFSEASDEEENEDEDILQTRKETPHKSEALPDVPSFSDCLGIPLIVVVTKSDMMKQLETEEKYTEEKFDFLQMHIRKFCLKYGAALFYVSLKKDKNIGLLKRYLMSRMYGFNFLHPANVIESDSILVPTGWDSEKKIDILGEHFVKFRNTTPFEQVIIRPVPTRKVADREPELVIPDDQTFLSHLVALDQREADTPDGFGSISLLPDRLLERLADPTRGQENSKMASKPKPFYGKAGTSALPSTGPKRGDNVLKGILMGLVQKHAKPTATDQQRQGLKSTEKVPYNVDKDKTSEKGKKITFKNQIVEHISQTEFQNSKTESKRELLQRQGKQPRPLLTDAKPESGARSTAQAEMKLDPNQVKDERKVTDCQNPNLMDTKSGVTQKRDESVSDKQPAPKSDDKVNTKSVSGKEAGLADVSLTNPVSKPSCVEDNAQRQVKTSEATNSIQSVKQGVTAQASGVGKSNISPKSAKDGEPIGQDKVAGSQPVAQQSKTEPSVATDTKLKSAEKEKTPGPGVKQTKKEIQTKDVDLSKEASDGTMKETVASDRALEGVQPPPKEVKSSPNSKVGTKSDEQKKNDGTPPVHAKPSISSQKPMGNKAPTEAKTMVITSENTKDSKPSTLKNKANVVAAGEGLIKSPVPSDANATPLGVSTGIPSDKTAAIPSSQGTTSVSDPVVTTSKTVPSEKEKVTEK